MDNIQELLAAAKDGKLVIIGGRKEKEPEAEPTEDMKLDFAVLAEAKKVGPDFEIINAKLGIDRFRFHRMVKVW
jgi:hypothetical protein